jgi:hypothetical protein
MEKPPFELKISVAEKFCMARPELSSTGMADLSSGCLMALAR